MLPNGDPVELTHDSTIKLNPVFSPDGSRIAYGTGAPWDMWEVPVFGGKPTLLFRNASSLSWIDGGKRLLFSEITQGMHMAVVSTDEGRGQRRMVYDPPGERGMAHHSYLSPDGQWVLIVEMQNQGIFVPAASSRSEDPAKVTQWARPVLCAPQAPGLPIVSGSMSAPRRVRSFTSGDSEFHKASQNR
jgi:Tol biopolymer transport system component